MQFSRCKDKEPLKWHKVQVLPFKKIGLDIAKHTHYVIGIDYYSRWIEILRMKNKTSETFIELLKILFSKFGTTEKIQVVAKGIISML